ncbi:MAG: tyrosine-type recombinase/integrase [Elusimicrobiota bacterium]
MARIYQRKGKKGLSWYMDYAVEGRRVRKKLGRSKRLAELALSDVRVKIERREIGFTQSDKRLEHLIAEYLKHSKAHATTESHLLNVKVLAKFREFIGSDRLKNITNFQIEKFKNHRREEGAKPSTVNRELAIIKALFNRGVEWGFLPKSPAQAVKKFKEPKRQARFFAKKEVSRILNAAQGQLKAMVQILVNTGLRREELLHLTWDDVDLGRRLLIVQAKEGWRPKDYEVRHIPLNAAALQAFKSMRKASAKTPGFIFTHGNGGPLCADHLTHQFKALLKELKIPGHLHALRHTFASHLVMRGADLYTVAKLLGHADIKTTEIYAHLAPDFLKSAVERLRF